MLWQKPEELSLSWAPSQQPYLFAKLIQMANDDSGETNLNNVWWSKTSDWAVIPCPWQLSAVLYLFCFQKRKVSHFSHKNAAGDCWRRCSQQENISFLFTSHWHWCRPLSPKALKSHCFSKIRYKPTYSTASCCIITGVDSFYIHSTGGLAGKGPENINWLWHLPSHLQPLWKISGKISRLQCRSDSSFTETHHCC